MFLDFLLLHSNNEKDIFSGPGEFLFQYPTVLPFHTVHGVLKARILKWFAIPFSSRPTVLALKMEERGHKARNVDREYTLP